MILAVIPPFGSSRLPATTPDEGAVQGVFDPTSMVSLLNVYSVIFVVAFVVTLLATPLIRRAAIRGGIIDHPDGGRKQHRQPVAYLGGLAVFLGVLVAIMISYLAVGGAIGMYSPVPLSILVGIMAITLAGLADDIWGWDPRLKIAGQLVAAAALAIEDVGLRVAEGALMPLAHWLNMESLTFLIPLPGGMAVPVDLIYWFGVGLVAAFVLGGCNAANLIDGLDGLLSGTTAIMAVGLLAISLLMAVHPPDYATEPTMAGARIVLSLALLGAVLGFLPHNFNPATIFLGDCGSMLLGYLSIVIILMFGEFGQTHLVFAGLIIFSVPIMDTALAMIRRKISGVSMSAADDQHIHHQLKRSLGGVKRAVFAVYGIAAMFMLVGVLLAALEMLTNLRVRVVYAVAIVLFGFIGVIAMKAARRRHFEEQALRLAGDSAKDMASSQTAIPANESSPDESSPASPARSKVHKAPNAS